MSYKDKTIKNNLRVEEKDLLDDYLSKYEKSDPKTGLQPPKNKRNILGFGILIIALAIFFTNSTNNTLFINPVSAITNVISSGQPSESLLNSMNDWMVEMGYTGLSHDDLRELRSKGVTATYISNVRALGFTDLTLDQAVSLAQADVSSAFMAMMMELGYDLDVDDFLTLRRAGVTAHYTSNVHDLGYSDVTPEQLIRMRRIGLTTGMIENMQSERGEEVPLEEIIRYRISNQ